MLAIVHPSRATGMVGSLSEGLAIAADVAVPTMTLYRSARGMGADAPVSAEEPAEG